ncbi:hypothetical protein GH714_014733 [Hevea brasiliensis]|uniref:Uncharacterized protein n=1 Tax=Hevea brasiliensis TaxID=3981 RepID=A0A6A6MCE2_HEVBR|nr:hypothetical protein GH714_014733 [Hevea brasiliensis]
MEARGEADRLVEDVYRRLTLEEEQGRLKYGEKDGEQRADEDHGMMEKIRSIETPIQNLNCERVQDGSLVGIDEVHGKANYGKEIISDVMMRLHYYCIKRRRMEEALIDRAFMDDEQVPDTFEINPKNVEVAGSGF